MDVKLATHLFRSPSVRASLRREGVRLVLCSLVSLGATVAGRLIFEKPILEGVLAAAVGLVAVYMAWLIAALRTLGQVLREHGVLEQ